MRVRLRQIILTRILWIERTEVVFMEKPLVSVVMPVYNGERYIGKAIESALGQEVPVEVLVIDDCSAVHRACCNEIYGQRKDPLYPK